MLLQFKDVGKTYLAAHGSVVALDSVSLEIDRGMFVAVRGPSGCGKTTLLLTAGTLLAPDQGEVVVLGERPYQMRPDQRAAFRGRQLGFVFQQFHLIPYLNVLDNVLAPTLSLAGTNHAVAPQIARQAAEGLLERLGLQARSSHTPAQLSSGERQRCALARAMLNQPALLLADEPTGNLDNENAERVLNALRDYVASGNAVLLVTHDDRATQYADQTVWMQGGKLESTLKAS